MSKDIKKTVVVEIAKKVIRSLINERLKIDSPGNLHGDTRTQREFVMDIAKQHPYGIISLSDIAVTLGTTNNAITNTYGRLIRDFGNKEEYKKDFVKIIPEQPFRSAAVFQLRYKDRLTDEERRKAAMEEMKKYKIANGIYYILNYSFAEYDKKMAVFITRYLTWPIAIINVLDNKENWAAVDSLRKNLKNDCPTFKIKIPSSSGGEEKEFEIPWKIEYTEFQKPNPDWDKDAPVLYLHNFETFIEKVKDAKPINLGAKLRFSAD